MLRIRRADEQIKIYTYLGRYGDFWGLLIRRLDAVVST
jgi:hypothetical protein